MFWRIWFVEASFVLFEACLSDSDVLNVVLSGILCIVRKIEVKWISLCDGAVEVRLV